MTQLVVANFILIEEAAERCGLSVVQFESLVKEKVFPPPVNKNMWDRKTLRARLDFINLKNTSVDPGFVYFLETGAFIKIGWSRCPPLRRKTLQESGPYDIVLLGAFPGSLKDESNLHAIFNHLSHRNEWFRKSPALIAYIAWLKVVWRGDTRVFWGEARRLPFVPAGNATKFPCDVVVRGLMTGCDLLPRVPKA